MQLYFVHTGCLCGAFASYTCTFPNVYHYAGYIGYYGGRWVILPWTSTKQPITLTFQASKKWEAAEKTIPCMDKALSSSSSELEGYELYGRFVASEPRSITLPQVQQWAKLKIHIAFFNAQNNVYPMDAHYPCSPIAQSHNFKVAKFLPHGITWRTLTFWCILKEFYICISYITCCSWFIVTTPEGA